ncbi:MAG: hypothetical protein DDT36_01485 [Firmicutes bacterium]|nr:hypothetical protein [Bacillota bacterium]
MVKVVYIAPVIWGRLFFGRLCDDGHGVAVAPGAGEAHNVDIVALVLDAQAKGQRLHGAVLSHEPLQRRNLLGGGKSELIQTAVRLQLVAG